MERKERISMPVTRFSKLMKAERGAPRCKFVEARYTGRTGRYSSREFIEDPFSCVFNLSLSDPWIDFKIVVKRKTLFVFNFHEFPVYLLSHTFFQLYSIILASRGTPSVPFPSSTFHKPQIYRRYEVQYILGLESLSCTPTHCARISHEKDNG